MFERTKKLTKANKNLKNLSEIDPLTKVYNRRIYENHLAQEVVSSQTSLQPLSLMIIDIDFFKSYNVCIKVWLEVKISCKILL